MPAISGPSSSTVPASVFIHKTWPALKGAKYNDETIRRKLKRQQQTIAMNSNVLYIDDVKVVEGAEFVEIALGDHNL